MDKFTTEQRVKIIEFYFENGRSIVAKQRSYMRHFNVRHPPSRPAIMNLVTRFQEHGSVSDRSRSGRGRSVRTRENTEAASRSIEENPTTSTRRRSQELAISRSSLQRIQRDLHMYPYKVQLVQSLQPPDFQKRLNYAVRFQRTARNDNEFIHKLIMGDEAHFHLNGHVNKQNTRFWGTENPRQVHASPLHPVKVTAWCGVTSERVIGPFFFEDANENAVTVTAERYRDMLAIFVQPQLANMAGYWWQQDGATAHTARATMQLLTAMFQDRIISRNSDFEWPPRSPDLTAPDFWLWGYLKDKVYANKPRTIQELKANIRQEILSLQPQMLRSVMENSLERARVCEAENGGYLRDIIFCS